MSRVDRFKDGWVDEWIDRSVDGWTNRWLIDGWANGLIHTFLKNKTNWEVQVGQ